MYLFIYIVIYIYKYSTDVTFDLYFYIYIYTVRNEPFHLSLYFIARLFVLALLERQSMSQHVLFVVAVPPLFPTRAIVLSYWEL